ncbi:MAG: aminodeoxychorismate lyase [Verrucomicrobia bacterium]|nr:aminodeoxychorismate lyase [Verrucomicrobiota bacterium]
MKTQFIFLNGQFVPEDRAVVSVFDRGFLYGDGLFETMRVVNGQPFRWTQHLERLQHGADFLKIKLPFPPDALRWFVGDLIAQNEMPDSLLRLTLSRGVGPRGYSPKGAESPTLVMTLHPAPGAPVSGPASWKLITSSLRLPVGDPLARFKTANKLAQVLARAEADAAGADEVLLLDTNGHVAEASGGNLFWIERGAVCTPPLTAGILPGVTRAVIFELCQKLNLSVRETNILPAQLRAVDGVFVSLSSFGVVEAVSLDGQSLNASPLVEKLRAAYETLLCAECA